MGVELFEVAEGVTNLQMPDGKPYDEGDVIELAVATDTVFGRTPVSVDSEDLAGFRDAVDNLVGAGSLVRKGVLSSVGNDSAGNERALWSFSVDLADITAAELIRFTPEVAGTIVAAYAVVDAAVTTAAKLATLSLAVNAGTAAGTIALTSAAATPANKIIAGSTTTANNTFDADDDLVITASAVTAFVEGKITIYVLLTQA